jgi:hypothetical protein
MKDSFVSLLIADRARIIPLLVGLVLALSGRIITAVSGVDLTTEEANMITVIFTLAFGWLLDAWAAEVNAKGAGKLQEVLKKTDPTVVVDRYIGKNTVAATQKLTDSKP